MKSSKYINNFYSKMKTIQLASGLEPQNIPKEVNGRKLKDLLENCAKEDEKKMFEDENYQIRKSCGLAKGNEKERIIHDKTFALGKNTCAFPIIGI